MKIDKHILVITTQDYNDKNATNYFEKEFLACGFTFTYWSLSPILLSRKRDPHTDHSLNHAYFYSYDELKKAIYELENKSYHVFVYLPVSAKNLEIQKLLKKNAIQFFKIDYNSSISNFTVQNSSVAAKISYFNSPKKIVALLQFKLLQKLYAQEKFDVINFRTGKQAIADYSLTFDDYWTYEEIKNNPRVVEDDYILFLDVFLPLHIDFKVRKLSTIDPDVYFKKLTAFFKRVERQFKMPVVIAAHPKSNYTDQFTDFKIIKNKTAQLVKDASLILNHHSSTISYVTLFKKPVIYIYTNEFLDKTLHLHDILLRMKFQSNFFKTALVNIEDGGDLEIPVVHLESYQQFVTNYLKSMKYPASNFEIVKAVIDSTDE